MRRYDSNLENAVLDANWAVVPVAPVARLFPRLKPGVGRDTKALAIGACSGGGSGTSLLVENASDFRFPHGTTQQITLTFVAALGADYFKLGCRLYSFHNGNDVEAARQPRDRAYDCDTLFAFRHIAHE